MRNTAMLPALFLAALACSDDNNGPTDGGGTPTGDIIVQNNSFSPSTFTATVGDEVVWQWAAGAVTHNVTFEDGEQSSNQSSGTYSRTFTAAGTFPYLCTIHGAAMSGVVNVAASDDRSGAGQWDY